MVGSGAVANILLVETDPALCVGLERSLRKQSYRVHAVTQQSQGLRMIYKLRPDLIIVGDDSPAQVLSICQDIRRFIPDVPLLLLVPPDETVRVRGLTLGADECLYRTIHPSDMIRRVRNLLDTSPRVVPQPAERYVIDRRLTIHLEEQRVVLNGNEQCLSPTETRLLTALLQHQGQTVPYTSLIARVWGHSRRERIPSLKLYIWYLRQKIEENPSTPYYILTVRRRGYLFRGTEMKEGSQERRR